MKNYQIYLIFCIAVLPAIFFRDFFFSEMPFLFAAEKLASSGLLTPEVKEMILPPAGNLLTLSGVKSATGSFSVSAVSLCALVFSIINAEIVYQIMARQFSAKVGCISQWCFLLISLFAFFNIRFDMILVFLLLSVIGVCWLVYRTISKKGFALQTTSKELPKPFRFFAYGVFAIVFLLGLALPKINRQMSPQTICKKITALNEEENKITVVFCHNIPNLKDFKLFLTQPMSEIKELNDLLAVYPNSVLLFKENAGITSGLIIGKKVERFGKYYLVDLRY
jgi:hypothetical protein